MKRTKPKLIARWYGLEVFKDGKWQDAGYEYVEDTKRECRKEMVKVNFCPNKVRMVEFASYRIAESKAKDTRYACDLKKRP